MCKLKEKPDEIFKVKCDQCQGFKWIYYFDKNEYQLYKEKCENCETKND